MNLTELAAALDRQRLRQKMTQVELARRSGLSRLSVAHALAGKDHRVSSMVALAEQLDLELELLPRNAVRGLLGGTVEVREDSPPMSMPESIRRKAAEARARVGKAPG